MIFGSARLYRAGHWRNCLPARAISRRSSVREHRSEYGFIDGHRPLWCLNECGECGHEFVNQPAFLTASVFDHVQKQSLDLARPWNGFGWSLSITRMTFGEAAFSAHLCASAALPLSRSGQTASTGRLNFRAVCCSCSANFTCLRKGGQVCYTVTGDSRFHAILGAGPSYIVHPSDTAPALVALGAQIKIVGPSGEKTIPLEKFFVLPSVDYKRENILTWGEIVTESSCPRPSPVARVSTTKVRERLAWATPSLPSRPSSRAAAEPFATRAW
jgi:hypothetical protein